MAQIPDYTSASSVSAADILYIVQSGQSRSVDVTTLAGGVAAQLNGNTDLTAAVKTILGGQPRGRGYFMNR